MTTPSFVSATATTRALKVQIGEAQTIRVESSGRTGRDSAVKLTAPRVEEKRQRYTRFDKTSKLTPANVTSAPPSAGTLAAVAEVKDS
jgi:hypothetical protein